MYSELEILSDKIEGNTASLDDYKRYEHLLTQGGLSRDYIFSRLNKAGYYSWEEFVEAREDKEFPDSTGATTIGGLTGLGVGLILEALFRRK